MKTAREALDQVQAKHYTKARYELETLYTKVTRALNEAIIGGLVCINIPLNDAPPDFVRGLVTLYRKHGYVANARLMDGYLATGADYAGYYKKPGLVLYLSWEDAQ